MITENQFNDAMSRIFLRFDKMDEKIDNNYKQLKHQIDYIGTRLDDHIAEQKAINAEQKAINAEQKAINAELKAMNAKMDERIARLEDAA